MQISDILSPDRTCCEVDASSKKRSLELLSELMADTDTELSASAIFDALIARERLGSTGLGEGVAIPHCRLGDLPHAVGAFMKLRAGTSFDAPDGQPVDLLFGLLVPEVSTDEHLEILSQLAELFSDAGLRAKLREAGTAREAFELLTRAVHEG